MITKNKIKPYVCKYCQEKYNMMAFIYAKRSLSILKKCCTNSICQNKAYFQAYYKNKAKKQAQQKREWKERKKVLRHELTNTRDYLQDEVNWIVKQIDKNERCIARPNQQMSIMDAGHVFARGTHPALKYNLHNIFGQSRNSNSFKGGESDLMQKGIEARYGKKQIKITKGLVAKYKVLKLTAHEYHAALKNAKDIVKAIKKGKQYTREQVNKLIGIYE